MLERADTMEVIGLIMFAPPLYSMAIHCRTQADGSPPPGTPLRVGETLNRQAVAILGCLPAS
jgi:hypothetical protein